MAKYVDDETTVQPAPRRPKVSTEDLPALPRDKGQLVTLMGEEAGRTFPLTGVEALIGRAPEADVSLRGSDISRRHALIRRTDDGVFIIKDLGSRNGTEVNGAPVTEQPLKFGDKIRVGSKTILLFTQHDRVEDMLLQAQKLESIGQLAGGVAHDFNNLLGAILANVSYLRGVPQDTPLGEDPIQDAIDDIRRAAERASELTKQLLGIARRGAADQRPLDLSGLLEEVRSLVSRTMPPTIAVQAKIGAGLRVKADASQLHQVLMNLCINARDAMPTGGTLTLRATRRELRESDVLTLPFLAPGACVQITVADTGIGMSQTVRSRLFEPFFTTKPEGGGTGMGLAIAYGIIKSHGGQIQVESEPGKGSRFHVYLPAIDAAVEQTPRPTTILAGTASLARGLVLLVEDEPILRKSTQRLLEGLGYGVLGAADGEEAVDLFRQHHKLIEFVLLDMVMPKLAGPETFHALRRIKPEIQVVLTSGYVEEGSVSALLEAGAAGFLHKPYETVALVEAVTRALAARTR